MAQTTYKSYNDALTAVVNARDANDLDTNISDRFDVDEIFAEMQVSIDRFEKMDKARDALQRGVFLKPMEQKLFDATERYRYLQFRVWAEQFSDTVINSSFTNAEKRLFLKNYTSGEAHWFTARIVHAEGFVRAFERLSNTYGQSSNIISDGFQMLHELQAIGSAGSSAALRTFYTKMVNALAILKHQGVAVYNNQLGRNSIYKIICARGPAT